MEESGQIISGIDDGGLVIEKTWIAPIFGGLAL
jgi:hypothetical protein